MPTAAEMQTELDALLAQVATLERAIPQQVAQESSAAAKGTLPPDSIDRAILDKARADLAARDIPPAEPARKSRQTLLKEAAEHQAQAEKAEVAGNWASAKEHWTTAASQVEQAADAPDVPEPVVEEVVR